MSEPEANEPDKTPDAMSLLNRVWGQLDPSCGTEQPITTDSKHVEDGTTIDHVPLGATVYPKTITFQEIPDLNSPRLQTRIGRFRIVHQLGAGGFGLVFAAEDPTVSRVVALKIARPQYLFDSNGRDRFLSEARLAGGLNHPGIVQVYEAGDEGGVFYIASELCEGPSLSAWLHSQRDAIPTRAIARCAWRISQAVGAAHQKGIIHRDLKPGNILLVQPPDPETNPPTDTLPGNWLPKVTDFGLAKLTEKGINQTTTGAVAGTPQYMAPEQADGDKNLGTPADVWAIGVMLYEMLTGVSPFRGESVMETLRYVCERIPIAPRQLRFGMPRDLETICMKCLEKDPKKRYPTATHLADDLGRFLAGQAISARPVGTAEKAWKWCRRNPALAGLLGTVSVAATALIVTLLVSDQQVRAAFGREKQANVELHRTNVDLDAERTKLAKSNDDLVGALADALIAPVAVVVVPRPLSPFEIDAFWSLASRRTSPVAYRFIETSTSTPLACNQLATRAEFALHAAVGLDRDLCARVEQRLSTRLDALGSTSHNQPDLKQFIVDKHSSPVGYSGADALALAAPHLGSLRPELAERAAKRILRLLKDSHHSDQLQIAMERISALCECMTPEAVAAVIADELATTDSFQHLSERLSIFLEIANSLNPDVASARTRQLLDVSIPVIVGAQKPIAGLRDDDRFGEVLTKLANYLEPGDATQTLRCVQVKVKGSAYSRSVAQALAATALRFPHGQALDELSTNLKSTGNSAAATRILILAAIEACERPDMVADPAAVDEVLLIAGRFLSSLEEAQSYALGDALVTLTKKLPQSDHAKYYKAAVELFASRGHVNPQAVNTWHIAIARLLLPEQSLQELLRLLMRPEQLRSINTAVVESFHHALGQASEALPVGDASAVLVRTLTDSVRRPDFLKNQRWVQQSVLTTALSTVVRRLPDIEANRTCANLAEAFTRPELERNMEWARALCMVTERMELRDRLALLRSELEKVSSRLNQNTQAIHTYRILTRERFKTINRLTAKETADQLDQHFPPYLDTILYLISRSGGDISVDVCEVVRHFTPELSKIVRQGLLERIGSGVTEPRIVDFFAKVLRATSQRSLPVPEQVYHVAIDRLSEATRQMNARMTKSADAGSSRAMLEQTQMSNCIAAASQGLTPSMTAKVLLRTLTDSPQRHVFTALTGDFVEAAARMPADQARGALIAFADLATGMLRETPSPTQDSLSHLAYCTALASLAKALPPTEGAEFLIKHLSMLYVTEDFGKSVWGFRQLAVAVTGVAANMTTNEGIAFRRRACHVLLQAMPACRLTKLETAVIVPAFRSLALGRTLASDSTLLAAIGHAYHPRGLAGLTLPTLDFKFTTAPNPLPTEDLVALLKHPFCVGETQLALLDVLGCCYRRVFTNKWDFVEYARNHQPSIDLLSPPLRP